MSQTSRSLKYFAISSVEVVELFFIRSGLAFVTLGGYLGRLTKLWGEGVAMIPLITPLPDEYLAQ